MSDFIFGLIAGFGSFFMLYRWWTYFQTNSQDVRLRQLHFHLNMVYVALFVVLTIFVPGAI
jgi:hypothetical protein